MNPPRARLLRFILPLVIGLFAAGPILRAQPWLPGQEPATDVNQVVITKIGSPMPAWSVTSLDGAEISSASLLGKVVVVDFWATWCAPCLHEIPGYVTLQKKYAARGLVIVGVAVEKASRTEQLKKFVERYGISYPIALINQQIGEALIKDDSAPLPLTFVVDREGIVRFQKAGALDTDAFEKILLPLL